MKLDVGMKEFYALWEEKVCVEIGVGYVSIRSVFWGSIQAWISGVYRSKIGCVLGEIIYMMRE